MFKIIGIIIAVIILLFLMFLAIELLLTVLPLIILIGVSYWLVTTWGWMSLVYFMGALFMIGIIANILEKRKLKKITNKVQDYFLQYEMTDYQDLREILKPEEVKYLDDVLQVLIENYKVERIHLRELVLYKWIAPATFSQGVIRKEFTMD